METQMSHLNTMKQSFNRTKNKVESLDTDIKSVQKRSVNMTTLVNVNAPVVATTSWWLHFSAQVVA